MVMKRDFYIDKLVLAQNGRLLQENRRGRR